MKNLLAPLTLLLLLAACHSQPTDTAALDGKLEGLDDDTLYVCGTDQMYDRTDTLIANGGSFSASLRTDTLVQLSLILADGTQLPLFIDKGDHVRISGDVRQPDRIRIDGNAHNDTLTAFRLALADAQADDHTATQRARTFIEAHPTSMASIALLDHYFVQRPDPDYSLIKELAESLSGELRDRPYMTALTEQLELAEKAGVNRAVTFFSLPDTEGEQVARNDFKDQHLLMHFWASWDAQSRADNAMYRRLYRQEKDNPRFALLGVSLDVDRQAWLDAVGRDTLSWTQVCDLKSWNSKLIDQLAVFSLPANILISPNGRIAGRNLSEEEIGRKLEGIAKEKPTKSKSKSQPARKSPRLKTADKASGK